MSINPLREGKKDKKNLSREHTMNQACIESFPNKKGCLKVELEASQPSSDKLLLQWLVPEKETFDLIYLQIAIK